MTQSMQSGASGWRGVVARASDTAPVAALLAFTLLVAAATFVLTFYGNRDYAWRLAGVPVGLAWLVPVGVDGLTLVAIAATFALRHAPWRARLYAWLVFAVAVAASMAGNLAHAAARELPAAGMVGATAWPALLAVAVHLLIVTWRHLEPNGRRVADTKPSVASKPAPRRPASRRSKQDRAVELYREGKSCSAIALELRTAKRNVERWTKDLRADKESVA